jgi:DNA excision repair protein ERCC-6
MGSETGLTATCCHLMYWLLFTDVHSALQHDKIMMSSNPDYLLVEKEADRVAKDAADALRRSRDAARSLPIGVPTWTGQHGGGQAAAK